MQKQWKEQCVKKTKHRHTLEEPHFGRVMSSPAFSGESQRPSTIPAYHRGPGTSSCSSSFPRSNPLGPPPVLDTDISASRQMASDKTIKNPNTQSPFSPQGRLRVKLERKSPPPCVERVLVRRKRFDGKLNSILPLMAELCSL